MCYVPCEIGSIWRWRYYLLMFPNPIYFIRYTYIFQYSNIFGWMKWKIISDAKAIIMITMRTWFLNITNNRTYSCAKLVSKATYVMEILPSNKQIIKKNIYFLLLLLQKEVSRFIFGVLLAFITPFRRRFLHNSIVENAYKQFLSLFYYLHW